MTHGSKQVGEDQPGIKRPIYKSTHRRTPEPPLACLTHMSGIMMTCLHAHKNWRLALQKVTLIPQLTSSSPRKYRSAMKEAPWSLIWAGDVNEMEMQPGAPLVVCAHSSIKSPLELNQARIFRKIRGNWADWLENIVEDKTSCSRRNCCCWSCHLLALMLNAPSWRAWRRRIEHGLTTAA